MCFKYIFRFSTIIFCLFLCLSISAQTPNSWRRIADFPDSVRHGAAGFSINGKGYLFGGKGKGQYEYLNDLWEYDPAANKWTKKASMPARGRFAPAVFTVGGKAYIGTGDIGDVYNPLQDMWEYDPATDKWTQKADFPGGKRADVVGFSIGTKGYMGTGSTYEGFSTEKSDFWEYDPTTDQWTRKADFGGGKRRAAVGFAIGNKGYLGTGVASYVSPGSFTDFWEYDPATNIWTQKANVGGLRRWSAIGFGLDNTGYVGMGITSTDPSGDFWEYDPLKNIWTQKANISLTDKRLTATAFAIGNKGYVGAGNMYSGDGLHKDFWEYQYDHYIITDTVKGGPFCGNATVKIPFKSIVTFNSGNVFTAQLSDASGSFNAPVNIGTRTGVLTDTIIGTMPNTVPSGNYKIRIVSSAPSIVNSDGATSVTIYGTIPAIHIVADKESICRDEKVTFTASPIGGGNAVFYWKKNYLVMTGYGAVYTDSTLNENDQVSCTVQTDVGCITNKQAQSNVIAIDVHSWVTPTVAITATKTTICAGKADTFYAASTKGGVNPTYQWKKNNADVGIDSSIYIDNSLNDSDRIYCIMTSDEMCPRQKQVQSGAIDITVKKLRVSLTTSGPTSFCDGGSVALNAITNTKTAHYQWLYNNWQHIGGDAPLYNAIGSGGYRVQVFDTAGQCRDTITSTEQLVIVQKLPAPGIIQSGNVLSTGNYKSYQWYNGNIAINGATKQIYTVVEDGVYAVLVTDDNNCSNISPFVRPQLNIGDYTNDIEISIYPNPAQQKLFVNTPVPVVLSLYDVTGRFIIRQESTKEFNIESVTPGIYILRITDKDGSVLKMERISIL